MTPGPLERARALANAREAADRRKQDLRRNAAVVVLDYLRREGHLEALNAVEAATGVTLDRYQVCDNIELEGILQEYEDSYQSKYGRPVHVVRKAICRPSVGGGPRPKLDPLEKYELERRERQERMEKLERMEKGEKPDRAERGERSVKPERPPGAPQPAAPHAPSHGLPRIGSPPPQVLGQRSEAARPGSGRRSDPAEYQEAEITISGVKVPYRRRLPPQVPPKGPAQPQGRPRAGSEPAEIRSYAEVDASPESPMAGAPAWSAVAGQQGQQNQQNQQNQQEDPYDLPYQPVLQPVPAELKGFEQLYRMIQSEILTISPNVSFQDVIGLTKAKRILREAVILPRKYPFLFQTDGLPLTWKGLLLFGSPGCGKTILAKALATEARSVFFNVSAATLTSKWHGESEKLVQCLFVMARQYESSVIFIDEIEGLMSSRMSDGEHEASRRLKVELLQQIDGIASNLGQGDGAGKDSRVFVLCATNYPWAIDGAMLRRLEKRVYVELPNLLGRASMLRQFLGTRLRPEKPAERSRCAASELSATLSDLRELVARNGWGSGKAELSADSLAEEGAAEAMAVAARAVLAIVSSPRAPQYAHYRDFVLARSLAQEELLSPEFYSELVARLAADGLEYLVPICVATAGYSGADMRTLSIETCMIRVRRAVELLEAEEQAEQAEPAERAPAPQPSRDLDPACSDPGKIRRYLCRLFGGPQDGGVADEELEPEPEDRASESSDPLLDTLHTMDLGVGFSELTEALEVTRPAFNGADVKRYSDWSAEYGSG